MNNRKHKLPVTIAGICLIGLIGFKDTGIFVREYVSIDDATQVAFNEEKVTIIGEKQDAIYEIARNETIRTTKTSQKYRVTVDTYILDKPEEGPIRVLKENEILQILKFEDDTYGLFNTEDGIDGYVKLSDLEASVEENISYGVSKVDKVLKDNNLFYTLIKGETVSIKDFKDNTYIIIDENGNEFKANESYIDLRRSRERATRGSISRRGTAVTKVVQAAHEELGKPYVAGDTGKRGYDCSGLTYSIYLNTLGIKLNRSSTSQSSNGVEVKKEELVPGDLVFFRTSGTGIGHVGLYIGDNNMIHASSGRRQIMISSLDEAYYKQRYITARRIINN
ncbi:C40 family peptidase [Tissierella sp. MB52-C2]|uniref:C40 family peptidase n=1 Tax=Tissierella sp. MB52-C2 TaxID=3070999 RepID=UPI00280BA24A|nr:C40 family peptidase [Tissierella sp. MB52-C2]WMM23454.1 C40 family peptidase [Tissierella sp. MB52-C2]